MAESYTNTQYHTEHKLENDSECYNFFSYSFARSLSPPFLHIRSIQYYSKINLNFEFIARSSAARFALLFVSFTIFFVCSNSIQRIPHSYSNGCGASSAPSASPTSKLICSWVAQLFRWRHLLIFLRVRVSLYSFRSLSDLVRAFNEVWFQINVVTSCNNFSAWW